MTPQEIVGLVVVAVVVGLFALCMLDNWFTNQQRAQWNTDRIEELEANLRELLRLYDWRFELAKEEAPYKIGVAVKVPAGLRAKLRRYGEEKKQAWQATRELITGCSIEEKKK